MNKINFTIIAVACLVIGILAKSPFFIIMGIVFLASIYQKYKIIHPQANLESFLKDKFEEIKNNFSLGGKNIKNDNQTNYNSSDINNKPMETINPKKAGKIIWAAVGAVILVLILIKSIIIIPAGYTGVYHLFGKVKDGPKASGIHLINPLAKIEKMSIRTQEYTMSIATAEGKVKGDDSILALTKEGLSVALDLTILYHLDEQNASEVFKNIGINYEEIIIRPEIRTTIREVVAQYDAKEIYAEKRTEAGTKILENIKEKVEPRGIVIEDVLMRNVNLPQKLAESIESKLQAEQESQRYEFILEKETKEAERKRVEAAGQRDAQQIIAQGLTTNYLNYLYIKELKDRVGTIYVPVGNNGVPLFRGI